MEPSLADRSVRPEADVQLVTGGVDAARDLPTIRGNHGRLRTSACKGRLRSTKIQSHKINKGSNAICLEIAFLQHLVRIGKSS